MADAPLERNVADELLWDPRIDNEMIAVSADDDGTITLCGTVGSFRQRREAKKAAERVFGVTKVTNDLDVQLLTEHRRMASCVPTTFRCSCSTRLCRPLSRRASRTAS
jgi:hypothetical protein